ncbi:MAG: ABC transporter permease [Phycisphaeraceae bacterium]|nr:ABC transporter permease [Phycisphaeraceae bacterium]
MLLQVLTIARTSLLESLRQPITFFLILLSGVLQILNTWATGFAMGLSSSGEVSGDNKLLLDIGLATIFGCGMLLAAFIATAVVSREIENKTALMVVSKPVARATVILGKYLGVAGAISLATLTMLIFLLLGLRHGVMSTAADDLDGPVILFSTLALLVSVGLGAWGNFFYGWSFPQVVTLAMLPAFAAAYLGTLGIGKEWKWQELGHDFKPQIMVACVALGMAILVLSSVATAVSTRLGQVMTIVACAGVFLIGLLSNYLVGRFAFENRLVAFVRTAISEDPSDESFAKPGQRYDITLDGPPTMPIEAGASFYYGPNPNGSRLAVPAFEPFSGDLSNSTDTLGMNALPAIIVESITGDSLTIRHIGSRPLAISRPPRPDDAIFLQPTRTHVVARAAWGAIPNLQLFWLMDAVSQNRAVPAGHLGLIAAYSLAQITAFLSLGVALFQTRDMG